MVSCGSCVFATQILTEGLVILKGLFCKFGGRHSGRGVWVTGKRIHIRMGLCSALASPIEPVRAIRPFGDEDGLLGTLTTTR